MKRIAFCVLFGIASVSLIGCAEKAAPPAAPKTETPAEGAKMDDAKPADAPADAKAQ